MILCIYNVAILLMLSLLYLISPAHSLSRRLTEYYICSVSVYIILFCTTNSFKYNFFNFPWPALNI